jgi:hypothetical protein
MRSPVPFFLLSLAIATAANAQDPKERDWSQALKTDAQALHDDIAQNHPGPVNPLDPGFAANNDRQLAIALDRAKTAKSYGDYFFPLRIYVSSFNDGHMSFGALGSTPNNDRWPGFATRYDGRDNIVVSTEEAGSPVPKGAQLVSCDGMSAKAYADATLGKMWGRWPLESQHRVWGALLFLDESSGLIPMAKRCTFLVNGKRAFVALDWRPIDTAKTFALVRALEPHQDRQFTTKTLADGTRWISIPSFSGDPGSPAVAALPGIIRLMASDRAAFQSAPAIVLDLRGNGGGSSDWSRQIAVALWGQAAVDALSKGPEIDVDWRASPANLAAIASAYADRRGTEGFSPEMDQWYRSVIAGLGTAIARKQQLWRHVDFDPPKPESEDAPVAVRPLPRLTAPVYVLTDSACASACLDALDIWTALGAIQIGRPTSADTLYMEVRQRVLPSGITSVSMPMKVYRGRKRGNNQPALPVHRFDGDIGDTAAIEAWVARLPERRR